MYKGDASMFQFYLSSIKSNQAKGQDIQNTLFQFYLSSIKSTFFKHRINSLNLVSILP